MLLFKRVVSGWWLVASFCLLLQSSCGFQPIYGENSAFSGKTPLAGNLLIENVKGREGQILKIALEDKINPERLAIVNPEYILKLNLTKNLIPAVVKSDGTIQRYDIQFSSDFNLIQKSDGKVILTGKVTRTGSYNVAANANFATYQAEQDATSRTLNEIAEDYVLRIAGYFAKK
ncbi:MAG: LPS assembly lipoprotein LptE [Pseudomonadota bacterium]